MIKYTYCIAIVSDFNITAYGEAGHGSTLPKYTAGQRLQVVIDKLLEYRESELQKIEQQNVSIEHVTSLNLVQLGVNAHISSNLQYIFCNAFNCV